MVGEVLIIRSVYYRLSEKVYNAVKYRIQMCSFDSYVAAKEMTLLALSVPRYT